MFEKRPRFLQWPARKRQFNGTLLVGTSSQTFTQQDRCRDNDHGTAELPADEFAVGTINVSLPVTRGPDPHGKELSGNEDQAVRRQRLIWLLSMSLTQLSWFSTIAALVVFIIKFGTGSGPGFLIWFLLSLTASLAASATLWTLWDRRRVRRRIELKWLELDCSKWRVAAHKKGKLADRAGLVTERSRSSVTQDRSSKVTSKDIEEASQISVFRPSGDLYRIGQPKSVKVSHGGGPSTQTSTRFPQSPPAQPPKRHASKEEAHGHASDLRQHADQTWEYQAPEVFDVRSPASDDHLISPMSQPNFGYQNPDGGERPGSPIERVVSPLERIAVPFERAMSPVERAASPLDRRTSLFERATTPMARIISPSGNISYRSVPAARENSSKGGSTKENDDIVNCRIVNLPTAYLRESTSTPDGTQHGIYKADTTSDQQSQRSASLLRALPEGYSSITRASSLEDEIYAALGDARSSRHGLGPPTHRLHKRSYTAISAHSLPVLAELSGSPVEFPPMGHRRVQTPHMTADQSGQSQRFPLRRSSLPPGVHRAFGGELRTHPALAPQMAELATSSARDRPTTAMAEDGFASFLRDNVPPYPTAVAESHTAFIKQSSQSTLVLRPSTLASKPTATTGHTSKGQDLVPMSPTASPAQTARISLYASSDSTPIRKSTTSSDYQGSAQILDNWDGQHPEREISEWLSSIPSTPATGPGTERNRGSILEHTGESLRGRNAFRGGRGGAQNRRPKRKSWEGRPQGRRAQF